MLFRWMKYLVINWDQTGIHYVPVSDWTMKKKDPNEYQL